MYEALCVLGEYLGHTNNPWRQTFNLMFVEVEQFRVMQKLHKYDLLSKAPNDVLFLFLFSFCPFCYKVAMLCLYNVTHVYTSFRFVLLFFCCQNSNRNRLALLLPYVQPSFVSISKRKGPYYKVQSLVGATPYHIKQTERI